MLNFELKHNGLRSQLQSRASILIAEEGDYREGFRHLWKSMMSIEAGSART